MLEVMLKIAYWIVFAANTAAGSWAAFVACWTTLIDPNDPDTIDYLETHPTIETVIWASLFFCNAIIIWGHIP